MTRAVFFDFRPYQPGDGDAVLAIHREAILAIGSEFYSEAERASWVHGLTSQGYEGAMDKGEVFDIAVDADDAPVAFCSRRDGDILALYVHPDWQGRGIGRELMARAEHALIADGAKVLRIHASLSAVPFYVACGYSVVESDVPHKSRGGLVLGSAKLEKFIAY